MVALAKDLLLSNHDHLVEPENVQAIQHQVQAQDSYRQKPVGFTKHSKHIRRHHKSSVEAPGNSHREERDQETQAIYNYKCVVESSSWKSRSEPVDAVSYTHLDVYKRQVLWC